MGSDYRRRKMATERCEHVQEVITREDVGAVCCWRPTWGERDRCIWHADEAEKPREAFDLHTPKPGERLDGAILKEAFLTNAEWLAGSSLIGADFTDALLRGTDFTGADLRRATFRGADAREAIFDRANIEDAEFIYTDIQGARFIDAKLDRTLYTGTRVNQETEFGDRVVYEAALDDIADRDRFAFVAGEAIWTYQELQRLLDENALHDRSLAYYLRERDLRRRVAWRTRHYTRAVRLEGSRWVIRYGTSPWRVVATSLVLILTCALLYPFTGGLREPIAGTVIAYSAADVASMSLKQLWSVLSTSLYFSVITFGTLGYGDIQPVGGWARALASVESLLGALLLALLVYVLTRSE